MAGNSKLETQNSKLLADDRLDHELRRFLECLLHRTLAGGAHQGLVVLVGKAGGDLDRDPHGAQAVRLLFAFPALAHADAVVRDISFLAEAENVDPGAGRE